MPSQQNRDSQTPMAVPALFKCPISLELMTDPVSLCTGVTYERASIEKWLDEGNNMCPATGQVLRDQELIPNHTLRSLIHKWCQANAFCTMQTPEPPAEPVTVRQMLREIDEHTPRRLETLRRVKNLAKGERNRRCLKSQGTLPVLIRVLERFRPTDAEHDGQAVQEAVEAIGCFSFSVDDAVTRRDLTRPPVIRTLEWVLLKGDLESRMRVAALVEKVAADDKTAAREIGTEDGITDGLLTLFQQNLTCPTVVECSLKALLSLCSAIKCRARIAGAEGAVQALVELLPDAERVVKEQALAVLEALCSTSEGRSAIMAHALSMPTVVKSLLAVSDIATDYGVSILLAICFNCGEEQVLTDVVEMGTFEKLLILLQMKCGQRTKHTANQLLRILSPLRERDSYIHSSSSLQF
uniref:RING-type E3 ubiquitin transferase n=1 Tax=Araucaria cunninghamii TaxID=56994 RepID=A0A0D6QT65_ARACU